MVFLTEEKIYLELVKKIELMTGESFGGSFGLIAPRRAAAKSIGMLDEFNNAMYAMWDAQALAFGEELKNV